MAKIDIDDVISAITLAGVEGEQRTLLMEKINMFVKEQEEERLAAKVPKRKNQHVVVIKTSVPITDDDVVASVYTMPEDDDAATLLDRIRAASVDSNLKKKAKKAGIKTFTDSLSLKAKFAKERDFKGLVKQFGRVIVITPEKDAEFLGFKIAKDEDFS